MYLFSGCGANNVCEQISPQYYHVTLNNSSQDSQTSWYQKFGFSIGSGGTVYMLFHHIDGIWTAGNSSLISSPPFISYVGDVNSARRTSVSWLGDGVLTGGNPASNTAGYQGDKSEVWTEYSFTVTNGEVLDVGFRDEKQFNAIVDLNRQSQEFWLSYVPLYAPTPVPSATVTPSASMCNVVSDGSNQSATSPWRVGGGAIIAQTCYNTPSFSFKTFFMNVTSFIDFWVIDLDVLYDIVPDVGVDTIMICFRVADYSLHIMGIRIPVPEFLIVGIMMSALGLWVGSASGVGRIVSNLSRKDI